MEEIIARLGLDGSAFQRGMSTATKAVDTAKQTVAELGTRLAALVSVGALLNLGKEAVQYASDITDAAAATRTGVEEYQALAVAARESGASMQQLDQALIKTTVSAEKAAEGEIEYAEAFAVLNINVEKFLALPTERKLEALGAAYEASGRSTEAYTALTDVLGTRAAPRLIEMLSELGSAGFDAVRKKAEEAGLVLNQIDAQKLDHLADQFTNIKIRTLVVVDEMISAWTRFFDWLGGKSRERIYAEEADAERVGARLAAVQQLINEGLIKATGTNDKFILQNTENLSLYSKMRTAKEAEALIEERISALIAVQNDVETASLAVQQQKAEAAARAAALAQSNVETANALKMIEEGRALIKLKEMSNEERLLALQGLHAEALDRAHNLDLLGEGTAKEKESIAKRVLDIEKQISDTRAKIDAESLKSAEERAKKEEDLLELMKQEAEIQSAIDQAAFNRYGRDSGDLATGGGSNSTLGRLASEADRLSETAQRQFDELARRRAAADGKTLLPEQQRDIDEAERRFNETEARRKQLEDQITGAQGGKTGDPLVDKMEETRKEIEELRKELESA